MPGHSAVLGTGLVKRDVVQRRYRPETLAPINNRILPAGLTRVQPKNISIGAQYLTDLFRLFGGDVELTLAD